MKTRKNFTLFELLIVMILVPIIAVMLLLFFIEGHSCGDYHLNCESNFKALSVQFIAYANDENRMPYIKPNQGVFDPDSPSGALTDYNLALLKRRDEEFKIQNFVCPRTANCYGYGIGNIGGNADAITDSAVLTSYHYSYNINKGWSSSQNTDSSLMWDHAVSHGPDIETTTGANILTIGGNVKKIKKEIGRNLCIVEISNQFMNKITKNSKKSACFR